ncbi:unnamed protein product [Linum trigynum]|uniref:Uncharacterized protein n=1 Tax=Linum trigynum TaxID=586398 RepID=A0AAV2DNI1_9ROSI
MESVDKRDLGTRHLWIPSLRLSGRCPITDLVRHPQGITARKPPSGGEQGKNRAFYLCIVVGARNQN